MHWSPWIVPGRDPATTLAYHEFTLPGGLTGQHGTGSRPSTSLRASQRAQRLGHLLPVLLLLCWGVLLLAGCGSEVQVLVNQGHLTLQVSVDPGKLVLVMGGQAETVEVSLVRDEDTGPVNLSLSGVPAGVSTEIHHPGILNRGEVTFQAGMTATPGSNIPVTITASDGNFFDTTSVSLSIVP